MIRHRITASACAHVTCEPHLFGTGSSHSLETSLVRLVDFWDLIPILAQLLDQLSGIQLAITSSRLDDLRLFLQCEVLPCEIWSHIFLEESQNLVVRNGSWVGEVVDTGIFVLGHEDGSREKIVENGIRVGNINYTVIFGNFGDEVSGVEVITDGHSKSEDEGVVVCLHNLRSSC